MAARMMMCELCKQIHPSPCSRKPPGAHRVCSEWISQAERSVQDLTEIKYSVSELLLDIDHEIEKTAEHFPRHEGDSILARLHNSNRDVALSGIYTIQSLALSRLSEFVKPTKER